MSFGFTHSIGVQRTVKVKGERFYTYIESTGIVNGEFIDSIIYVV